MITGSSVCPKSTRSLYRSGKAGSPYEFGPVSGRVSKVNGFIRIDKISSFDNFNESADASRYRDAYYEKHGVYPEVVRGDKIYQTRSNKMFCSERWNLALAVDHLED